MDRTAEAGKSKGGGVCFMTNKKWCDPRNISSLSRSCSPHLEHLSIICRPFYYPASSPRSSLLPSTFHHRQTRAWLCLNFTMCSAASLTNILTLPLSSRGILTKPTSGRSCRTLTSMYPVQLEDRIHWITATHSLKMPTRPRSLPSFGKSDHAAIFLTRNTNKGSHRNPRWRGKWRVGPPTRKLCCRRALDDVDWDMFRASSSDVSEFTDVAVSFVNTLTEQATETITVKTFPNQKPWVDRTIRDAVNKRTAAYNEALLSGNMVRV